MEKYQFAESGENPRDIFCERILDEEEKCGGKIAVAVQVNNEIRLLTTEQGVLKNGNIACPKCGMEHTVLRRLLSPSDVWGPLINPII